MHLDQGQIKTVVPCEVITFVELLFRWPSKSYLKILAELRKQTLKIYSVTKILKTKSDTIEMVVKDISSEVVTSTLTWMDWSKRFVFMLSDVKSIELENSDYLEKNLLLKNSDFDFDLCLEDNIEQLAAITIHLICKFNYSPHFELAPKYSLFHIRRALYKESETSECPRGPVLSWRIPKEKLYFLRNLLSEHSVEVELPLKLQILSQIHAYMNELSYDLIETVKVIYEKYPQLTNADLGALFPHDPAKKIQFTGIQSRGKNLKNRVYERYPELKQKIEESNILASSPDLF